MRFHVLTIFPDMFASPFAESIVGRARDRGLVEINLHDIREGTSDKHRTVDDYAFGGGPGMVMKPEPLFGTVETLRTSVPLDGDTPIVLLSPQGRSLTQPIVEELARHQDLVLICGRYEGVDERVRRYLATDELSIGDYVLGGGELPAMVIIDAVSRLVPGVVGSQESTQTDSFTTGLLQHPQYTRPAEFRGWAVPDVLLSGNHAEIARWRRQESLRRTFLNRPDLLDSAHLSDEDRRFIDGLRGQ
ncbi:MAG: tRNA (guanosine(37)-N1)-methyltransferase TrmD [SAR202 cluster bacterium]|jgi:tRNA (guanine37-N1)-methyltransferase|nr:tRNA (guanosine(37)-N1)-methyltransferase TrmD [SAR202 cluster bacterium]